MKRLSLFPAVLLCALFSFAQTNQMIWNNGHMQYAAPITHIDSLTFPDEVLDSDTLRFILPRATKQIEYVHDTTYVTKYYYIDANAVKGAFSVAEDKQVAFAKGNLQYIQSSKSWSFASNQYAIIGTSNVTGGTTSHDDTSGDSKTGTALADTIDLFGWSTNNTTAPWGISTSLDNSNYSGSFVDWGTNIGDSKTWRILSRDEWTYLFQTRTNANSKYGVARITLNEDGSQYVNGLVIIPDIWTSPAGITFKSGNADESSTLSYADYQTFTLSQWQQLEQAGAVFLPASGSRHGTEVNGVQLNGYYWSSTIYNTNTAYFLKFSSAELDPQNNINRYYGQSVRLVQDL